MTIFNEICKFKKALIKKAKTKGLYENFGQREINILISKYGRLGLIVDFESWALNYDGSA
jgi:hypothetical protein